MEAIFDILRTIGIFIGALFILVMIHELGHFLAARWFGMRVDRFSIGFPPRVFGKKIGDTDYCISATPLGGYVKIAGMVDESLDEGFESSEPQPWEYRSKPVWQRMVVITAGVVFNMILAVAIYSGMYWTYGSQEVPAEKVGTLYVVPGGLAEEVGFVTGDRLIGVNGERPVSYKGGNFFSISDLATTDIVFQVERNGQQVDLPAPAGFIDRLNGEPSFLTLVNALPSVIGTVAVGMPAEKAGLQAGDRVIALQDTSVGYWIELTRRIRGTATGDLNMVVVRGADTLGMVISPDPDTRTIGIGPVDPTRHFGVVSVDYGFMAGFGAGIRNTWETTNGIISGFGLLFSGEVSVRQNLGGPLAIANVTRQATDNGGWIGFWSITAFMSITLAIMNILPIPALDGGHLVFLVYEAIFRREPSLKLRMWLQQAGMVLLLGLMLFVTFNDILRFFGG